MIKPSKKNRIAITVVGDVSTSARQDSRLRRYISPDRVVCITQNATGTRLKHEGAQEEIAAFESLDDLVTQSGGALIRLTPIGFVKDTKNTKHDRRGKAIAINVDSLSVLSKTKRGTLISIDGIERQIIVQETASEIEALINGN